jgi:pilus assembly protein Flp/PilA
MKNFKLFCTKFINDESGQDLIEYALVTGLIALVAIATLRPLGTAIAGLFTTITTDLQGVLT